MFPFAVFIGAAVNIAGTLSYVRDTIQGRTKPNRVTWILWSFVLFEGVVAELISGSGWAVLPVVSACVCTLLIFSASFVNPNAYWKLELFDYLCGLFSLIAIVLWWFTHNPNYAIAFAIIGDFLATFPTLKKTWNHPETESAGAYFAGLFSALTGFAAVRTWVFSSYAFLVYLCFNTILLLFVIYRKRLLKMAP